MLQLQNVTKIYETKAGKVRAIDGISLTFPSSGLVFITGKSGCGKTTLLNVIGGLDGIDEGEILVQDKKFSTFSPSEYDNYRNTFIGFIFQEYNLLPEFTVEKNIKMAMELQGVQADETAFEKLLKDVEIEELKTRNPSELSGGQRQRVAIARALVKQPRIIMADEPTGALDSATGKQVIETLKKLSKDKLVIVVSHDREFAEKYADRVIHLVDGKVEQDVVFSEQEIKENVQEQENRLLVREGAELSEKEKDLLAKGVKECKQISVLKTLAYRDKKPTGEIEYDFGEPIQLRKSKMKLKSATFLGLKSLVVKPIRLVITVLISALAFAVFGLFDTVANFDRGNILQNYLRKNSSHAITATMKYAVDYKNGDSYGVLVSEETIARLSAQTDGKAKGVTESYFIGELRNASITRGRNYYADQTNGFLEFDGETEISENGNFKDFSYKIVQGRYPSSISDSNSTLEIAVSTYFADSIVHYLGGGELNGQTIETREDVLGSHLSVNGRTYPIVGLIDCGDIPEKYAPLKESNWYNMELTALSDDFGTYINAGAHKCFFVSKGFLVQTQGADVGFYVGNAVLSFKTEESSVLKNCTDYAYAARHYNGSNMLLFDGECAEGSEIALADDEILIHHLNLEHLFYAQIAALADTDKQRQARSLIFDMEQGTLDENRILLAQLFDLLNYPVSDGEIPITLVRKSTKTDEKSERDLKIVGVFFGVDKDSYTVSSRYKLMMSDALMGELGIYTEQGHYSKILFSNKSVKGGIETIVDYFMNEEGLSLTLYQNSALKVIQENEGMIRQIADLFLYVALVLALLAIFLLYNYVNTSIASKKQSVGILRGLGAGGKDILLMFLSESLMICLINCVFAVGFTLLGCALVNGYVMGVMNISIEFALFTGRQVLLICGVSLVTALVSSALPIIHIVKKKPVELIRRS